MYTWLVPDGSIPPNMGGEIPSHEAICFVNPTLEDAEVHIDVFFVDREPVRDISLAVPAERSVHVALGAEFEPGGKYEAYGMGVRIPASTPFSIRARCRVHLGCQYTRVHVSSSGTALMSTYVPEYKD
jgi:hypothetical protein